MGWTKEEALTGKPREHFKTFEKPIVYNEKEYYSYSALSKETKISDTTLKIHINKGFTVEEIVEYAKRGIRIKELVVDGEGNRFPSIKEMCKAHDISAPAYIARIKKGLTKEDALNNKLCHNPHANHTIKDPAGREYKSIKEMCDSYGTTYWHYHKSINAGKSMEEALLPVSKRYPVDYYIDLDGTVFDNIATLCSKYGISPYLYLKRLRKGWTKEDALMPANSIHNGKANPKYVLNGIQYYSIRKLADDIHMSVPALRKFHSLGISNDDIVTYNLQGAVPEKVFKAFDGKYYKSVKDLCSSYKVSQSAYCKRIDHGMTPKEALTFNPNEYTDWEGVKYKNFKEFCRINNINENTAQGRKRLGWTSKEIYEGHRENDEFYCTIDGKGYKSKQDLLRSLDISNIALISRIKKGMSIEDAVCDIQEKKKNLIHDHKGNAYHSKKEMCKAWGVAPNTYDFRIKAGMTVEEALTGELRKGISIVYNDVSYNSIHEFCDKLGISYSSFTKEYRNGASIEDIILRSWPDKYKDHTGEEIITKCGLKCKLVKKIKERIYS